MIRSQKIATELGQSHIDVTYDLAIAKVAMQIQATEKPRLDNLFIHLGAFHMMLAYFNRIGKYITDCGLMDVAVESDIIAGGSVNSFLSGKHFNRCKRLHPMIALGLECLMFEAFVEYEIINYCDEVRSALNVYKNVDICFLDIVKHQDVSMLLTKEDCLNGKLGKTKQFYIMFIHLVNHYLTLSRSTRTGDFILFKYILPKTANIFFVSNQPNYARWVVRYIDNLNKIEETHSSLHIAIKKGFFGIKRTDKAFSRQPVDITLEQTMNADAAKRMTGIIFFTNSISARQR